MIKRYLLTTALAAIAMVATAQDFDTDPAISIDNKKEDLHFTVGARMMADVAYYHTDFTHMKTGAALTDARIRTSMTFKDWYFYADFGFGGGKFSQKNIFLQYNWTRSAKRYHHSVRVGYFGDPSSMARNISAGSYHFISRPGSVNALSEGRQLGITYKFESEHWYAHQGIFADNAYNSQTDGYNGISESGRWLWRPVNNSRETFHIGATLRMSHLSGGEMYKSAMKKNLYLSQALETSVDNTDEFVCADLDWANNVLNVGAEFHYNNRNFFLRGEYIYKHVTKRRDDRAVYNDAAEDMWGSFEAWHAANPLRSNDFHGGYVEVGYKLFGPAYKYNSSDAVMGGLEGKALEVVARVNYTGLNDINSGEYYSVEKGAYYPVGYDETLPYNSSSVGGGNVCSATVGVNFSFNKYVKVMADYTYSHLDRDALPYDKNFHAVQGRVIFTF
jgi:phosphate-selective porin OprO/OprP